MNLRSAKKPNTQPSKPKKTTSPALFNPDAQPEPKELPVKRLKKSNKKIEIIQKTQQHGIPLNGSTDFKVCREKGSMVDKTEFIKEFIENPAKFIALFPRRFGKSTNLNMVKTFVEIESDKNGSELEDQNKSTPPYFLGGKTQNGERLKSMAISKHKAFVEKYMGKFPTIYVDFKEVHHGNDFESMENDVNKCIYKEYERHKYLKLSSKLDEYDKAYLTEILDSKKIPKDNLPKSLKLLSKLLLTQWGKKVFVFIDEYDAPINYIFWK